MHEITIYQNNQEKKDTLFTFNKKKLIHKKHWTLCGVSQVSEVSSVFLFKCPGRLYNLARHETPICDTWCHNGLD